MRPFRFKIAMLAGCLILAGFIFAVAQEDPFTDITFPITELGNCSDRETCEVYCDRPENMQTCLNFAKTHNLLAEDEIERAQRMLALGETEGPGGCWGMEACETYCDQIDHIKECITFAEKNNLIPADELEDAKKVIQAIDRGFIPPKCKGKKECDVYCFQPENMEECITFGKEAGLIPPEEIQDAEKTLEAIKKGVKPPACAGKRECDVYCSSAEHMPECMEFALAAGFMSPEEAENAKKMLEAIKKGVMPPNCQGKEECDVYCSQAEHMEECMEFGIAAGFIPSEEIEGARGALRAIKQGIKPPNCQGKEQCDIYCRQPEHMAECTEFSIAAGFMPAEEIENAKKMLEAIKKGVMPPNCQGKEECDVYCSQKEHFEECLNFSEAAGYISSEEAERMRQGVVGGQAPAGPGGCQTPEECQAFCQNPDNALECAQSMPGEGGSLPPGGQPMPGESSAEGGLPGEGQIIPPSEQNQPMETGTFPPPSPEQSPPTPPEPLIPLEPSISPESPQSLFWRTIFKFLGALAIVLLR